MTTTAALVPIAHPMPCLYVPRHGMAPHVLHDGFGWECTACCAEALAEDVRAEPVCEYLPVTTADDLPWGDAGGAS